LNIDPLIMKSLETASSGSKEMTTLVKCLATKTVSLKIKTTCLTMVLYPCLMKTPKPMSSRLILSQRAMSLKVTPVTRWIPYSTIPPDLNY